MEAGYLSRREFFRLSAVGAASLPLVLDTLIEAANAQPAAQARLEETIKKSLENHEPLTYVGLFEGKDNFGRMQTVIEMLRQKNIPHEVESYDKSYEASGDGNFAGGGVGSNPHYKQLLGSLHSVVPSERQSQQKTKEGEKFANIAFLIGKGQKKLHLTSHYDVHERSPGALDDAGSMVTQILLYERLRTNPPQNIGVIFNIFGDEENNLLGSAAYVKRHKGELEKDVIGVVSLELIGFKGTDRFGLYDVLQRESEVRKIFEYALKEMASKGVSYGVIEGALKPFYSDHRSFWDIKGLPAFGVVSTREQDRNDIGKYIAYPRGTPPGVLRYRHTPEDTSANMSNPAIVLAVDMLELAVRKLDLDYGKMR